MASRTMNKFSVSKQMEELDLHPPEICYRHVLVGGFTPPEKY